jgi:SAM-dependent methyltransferase
MPFGDGVFDAVWASQMIHHVVDLPAFADNLRRVLKAAGHVLLRGGFGPADRLPLFRYFPEAWAAGTAAMLALDAIGDVFARAGLVEVAHVLVEQTVADTPDALVERVATRSLSPLAGLRDDVFDRGLRSLADDARLGRLPSPVTERLDLVVFRSMR